MAVTKTPQSSTLNIKVQKGLTDAGKPNYVTRSFSNIKTGAQDSDVYTVGAALGSLQKYTVAEIDRTDKAVLINA